VAKALPPTEGMKSYFNGMRIHVAGDKQVSVCFEITENEVGARSKSLGANLRVRIWCSDTTPASRNEHAGLSRVVLRDKYAQLLQRQIQSWSSLCARSRPFAIFFLPLMLRCPLQTDELQLCFSRDPHCDSGCSYLKRVAACASLA
jgi:hypothetical protein